MSHYAYSSARNILVSDNDITSIVDTSNIKVGFSVEPDAYPCVTLSQIGGESYGFLGYKNASIGSRNRGDSWLMQVDIYSRDSVAQVQLIADEIEKAFHISGSGYRKVGDVDGFEEGLKAYHKVQTWSCLRVTQD